MNSALIAFLASASEGRFRGSRIVGGKVFREEKIKRKYVVPITEDLNNSQSHDKSCRRPGRRYLTFIEIDRFRAPFGSSPIQPTSRSTVENHRHRHSSELWGYCRTQGCQTCSLQGVPVLLPSHLIKERLLRIMGIIHLAYTSPSSGSQARVRLPSHLGQGEVSQLWGLAWVRRGS
jgi:hypothetical protein